MKLEDPVAPYRGIVAKHRRAHAASNAARMRLGGPAPTPRPSAGPVAVLGASEWALDEPRVEQTLAYIGMLGGLLADLGYDVFAISSLSGLDASPAFVGWVGGGETTSERDQLGAVDAPGVSISPELPARESWASIEPEGPPADIEFIRSTLQTIRRLTDQEHGLQEPASGTDPSTVSSTVRPGTGVDRLGRPR